MHRAMATYFPHLRVLASAPSRSLIVLTLSPKLGTLTSPFYCSANSITQRPFRTLDCRGKPCEPVRSGSLKIASSRNLWEPGVLSSRCPVSVPSLATSTLPTKGALDVFGTSYQCVSCDLFISATLIFMSDLPWSFELRYRCMDFAESLCVCCLDCSPTA